MKHYTFTLNVMDSLNNLLETTFKKLDATKEQIERERKFAYEAESRFKQNLSAFKEYYPNIYNAIIEFEVEGDLPIFVTSSGEGNILDQETGVAIYGDNPKKQAAEQVTANLNKPQINHIDFRSYANASELDDRLHIQSIKQLGEVVKAAGEPEPLKRIEGSFPTAIIFGVGLGYHIEELFERVNFNYTFIIEPSFQNFFLSLYCCDWKSVIERVEENSGSLFFHVGISYDRFVDDLINIGKSVGVCCLTKCFYYRHLPTPRNNELINALFNRIYEIHGGYGFYNDSTTSIAHTVKNTASNANLMYRERQISSSYLDKPVYIVGNGPSLDESIDFIKETQSDAIIVAAGTALQTLLQYDITPDFHVLIERPRISYDVLIETLPESALKDINLLTMGLIYPDVLPMYKWSGLACKANDAGGDLLALSVWSETNKSVNYPLFCNPMVSNTALSFMVMMGFKQLYLFGVDNGYSEGGRHHASNSVYDKGSLKDFIPPTAKRKLKGNLEGNVWATDLLATSNFQMERLLNHDLAKNIDCYNVGEGAYIKGAKPLKPELLLPDFGSLDKSQVIQEIKEKQFFNCSITNFETYLSLDKYEEICEHLIELSSEHQISRENALDCLLRQIRYLYSFKGTVLSHLFYVLEGEMLYFHCPMLSLLYYSDDEDKCLDHFNKARELWVGFLVRAKEEFKSDWLTKCGLSLEKHRMIKNDGVC